MAWAISDFIRRPWSLAPRPSLARDEKVLSEVTGPTTRVIFTDRQVIVSRALVFPMPDWTQRRDWPKRFPYSEIERLIGKPGLSEEDPMWGFTIETKGGAQHQVPMLWASRVARAYVDALAELNALRDRATAPDAGATPPR
jgi:hypothetical protein